MIPKCEIGPEKRSEILSLPKAQFTIWKVATKDNVLVGAVCITLRQYVEAGNFIEHLCHCSPPKTSRREHGLIEVLSRHSGFKIAQDVGTGIN